MKKRNAILMGAAGREFHNFNMFCRGNKDCKVVAFTANQIPGIEGRRYPKELAGKGYPDGIPIYDESDITKLIKKFKVDDVILSYSDLLHEENFLKKVRERLKENGVVIINKICRNSKEDNDFVLDMKKIFKEVKVSRERGNKYEQNVIFCGKA